MLIIERVLNKLRVAAKSNQECQKLGEKESKFGKYFVRNICPKYPFFCPNFNVRSLNVRNF